MSLISVIVPVYKVEAYLNRCVDSVLRQTMKAFELILVDDGSPDRSGEICDEYAKQDSRVRVIHQKNGGLSAARNAGIDLVFSDSKSEWITFVDSDDWVHEKYLEALFNATSDDVDVVIGGYAKTEGAPPCVIESKLQSQMYPVEEYYVNNTVTATIACGKLYRKKCFQNLRYPVGKLHEDEFVTYLILFEKKTVCVIEQPLYAYYQNPDSIIRSKWTIKRLDVVDACEQQVKFLENKGFLKSAKERFHFLIIHINEGRKQLNSCEELTAREKNTWKKKLKQKKKTLLINYREYHWITIKDGGLFFQAYDIFFPPFRIVYECGVRIKRLFRLS